MKKIIITFIFIIPLLVAAQKELSVVDLPPPNKLRVEFVEQNIRKNIAYGVTPPNYNGKVLVLVHGFLIDSWIFYREQTMMYDVAYKAGYKVVFSSTSSYEGDWSNGATLSRVLKRITKELNVPNVLILAHSNGGKVVEIAMFHHNARNLVERVVALGTPFWGTQVADIVQAPVFKWLADTLPWGEGTKLSTTFYCKSYHRPMMDESIFNQPEKFYTLGAWGYNSQNGYPEEGVPYSVSGALIEQAGGGVNDGIAPYYSTLRPGDTFLLESDDPRGNLNHMDIIRTFLTWDIFVSVFDKAGLYQKAKKINKEVQPYTAVSNYQILSSDKKDEYAFLDNQAKNLKITIFGENKNSIFNILSSSNKVIKKLDIGDAQQKVENNIKINQYDYVFKKDQFQNFKISSQVKSNYLAFVKDGIDQPMIYQIKKDMDRTILEVSFPNLSVSKIKSIILKASMFYIGDLEGRGQTEKEQNLFFKEEKGKFLVDVSNNKKGIYSLVLNAEIPNQYKRTLISGFTINKQIISEDKEERDFNKNQYFLLGNPIISSSILWIPADVKQNLSFRVTTIEGYVLKEFNAQPLNNEILIGNYLDFLPKGVYILNIMDGNNNHSMKIIK